MSKLEKMFEDIFKKELEPILLELDFSRYTLPKGWMQPSFLFKHRTYNIWFSCSWDWRDFYFEAELGSLYKFKDVLPRVIVNGFTFEKKCYANNTFEFITEQILNARKRIEELTSNNFEKYYRFIGDAQSEKLHRLKMYIEKEISMVNELPFLK